MQLLGDRVMIRQGIIHHRESLKLKTNDGIGIQKWIICSFFLGCMGTHLPCVYIIQTTL